MTTLRASLVALVVGFALAGCSRSRPPTAPAPSETDLSRSTAVAPGTKVGTTLFRRRGAEPRSDNRFFPLVPGTQFRYRSETEDGVETEVVTVTHRTREIAGVETIVVTDVVRLDGKVIERTSDYYAMDEEGTVWYFGEDALSIDPDTGERSTEGSWLAGEDGAEPGIIMKADPQVGDSYNEENAPDIAEDRARVIAVDATAAVPRGSYNGCLQTENTTPLEPGVLEHKFYAPGLGLVLEIDVSGGGARNELVSVTRPGSDGDDDERRDRGRGPGGRPRPESD